MDFDYSPWNPVVWALFGVFVVITILIIAAFHKKYPDYAKKGELEDE
jgi:hypothetical protein